MKQREDNRSQKLGFFSLSRKLWKEQIIFYILTTLSSIFGRAVHHNCYLALSSQKEKLEFVFLFYSKSFDDGYNHVRFLILFILVYSLVVFSHVWFANYLAIKVRKYVKDLIFKKMFRLSASYQDKQKISSLLNNSVKTFSNNLFFIPNQIYYIFFDVLLVSLSSSSKKSEWLQQKKIFYFFLVYLFLFILLSLFLNIIVYYSDLKLYSSLENEIKEEIFIVENRDLIVKKSQTNHFLNSYRRALVGPLKSFFKISSEAFSFVIPSYFILKIFPFLCLLMAERSSKVLEFIASLDGVLSNMRKLIERGRDFPSFVSSQKKINDFLMEPERDDNQKMLTFNEQITSLSLQNVSFSYGDSEKVIIKQLNLEFFMGRINKMNFPNGFGKSTIINLIVGMLKVREGVILINNKHQLSDVNLNWWRENISYSEHRNLVLLSDISTGQKQLVDLENSLSETNKQIFIFDESDSNLDQKNKGEFLRKLEELSKKKIVILVSHSA